MEYDLSYDSIFTRNIGIFTPEEQNRLKNAKVTIAGAGGVGGIQAYTLARMGVGEIALVDPGDFDPPDINRQYGAYADTMGKKKANVIAELLAKINPEIKITTFNNEISKQDLRKVMSGSNVVVDAIDLFKFSKKVDFARVARECHVYNLSAPIPHFSTILMVFDPEGMEFEEFFEVPKDNNSLDGFIPNPDKFFGDRKLPFHLEELLNGKTDKVSTVSGAAVLSGSVLATEASLIISGKRKKDDIITIPRILYVDLLNRCCQSLRISVKGG